MPAVTVVIPTFNMGVYLREAISSVLSQTFTDFEVIVVDDGSTDDTAAVVSEFGARVRYCFQDNAGQGAARNRAVLKSESPYIGFLDADDLWLPRKLERQVAVLEARPNVGLVGCGYSVRDEVGSRVLLEVIRRNFRSQRDLLRSLAICQLVPGSGSGVLARRTCFDRVGLFDPSLRFAQDWDMWLRMAKEFDAHFVEEVLLIIRKNNRKPAFRTLANEELYVGRVIEKNTPPEIKARAYAVLHARLGSAYLTGGDPRAAIVHLFRSISLHAGRIFPPDLRSRYAYPHTPRYYLAARAMLALVVHTLRRRGMGRTRSNRRGGL